MNPAFSDRHSDRQARLILIHADTGSKYGGFLSPIFRGGPLDGKYEPIPIPDDSDRGIKYRDIHGVTGLPIDITLAHVVNKQALALGHAHFDPDPIHLTYGDNGPTSITRGLAKFCPGDLLLWGSRLQEYIFSESRGIYTINRQKRPRVFLTGWLKVKRVLNFANPATLVGQTWRRLDNAHFIETRNNLPMLRRQQHIVVEGYQSYGGQLREPICISHPLDHPHGYPVLGLFKPMFINKVSHILHIGGHPLVYAFALDLVSERAIKNPRISPRWL